MRRGRDCVNPMFDPFSRCQAAKGSFVRMWLGVGESHVTALFAVHEWLVGPRLLRWRQVGNYDWDLLRGHKLKWSYSHPFVRSLAVSCVLYGQVQDGGKLI